MLALTACGAAATQFTARPAATRTHTTAAHSQSTSRRDRHRFQPVSVTATSASQWWVLGTTHRGARHCDSIEHTTDGGSGFDRLPTPPDACGKHRDAELRFADADDGYLYGDHLLETHDGGQHWHSVHLGGPVLEVAASDGRAYALVGHGHRRLLYASTAGSERWSRLPAPRDLLGGLWVQGAHLFAQNQRLPQTYIGKHLLVSLDSGMHWHRDRAPIPGLPCQFDQVKAPVLWEWCSSGMMSGIWRSTNNGRTFRHGPEGEGESTNGAAFAAADGRTAVIGFQRLLRTSDRGRHYRPVGPRHHTWAYVGFTDASHGLAILSLGNDGTGPTQLWSSRDAGKHWYRVSIH
jgi:photosystem II stability/assembly factor-like uncharacterized protein